MDRASLETLLETHGNDICNLVRPLRRDLEQGATREELLGLALPALVDAYERFDPSRGVKFWTFAWQRVRGAALDEFRAQARAEGRVKARRCKSWRAAYEPLELGSEDSRSSDHPRPRAVTGGAWSRLIRSEEPTPESALEHAELVRCVLEAVEALPACERLVIRAIYLEGRCLDDIGAEIGVSRSWASRIHTRAIKMLKERLAA